MYSIFLMCLCSLTLFLFISLISLIDLLCLNDVLYCLIGFFLNSKTFSYILNSIFYFLFIIILFL